MITEQKAQEFTENHSDTLYVDHDLWYAVADVVTSGGTPDDALEKLCEKIESYGYSSGLIRAYIIDRVDVSYRHGYSKQIIFHNDKAEKQVIRIVDTDNIMGYFGFCSSNIRFPENMAKCKKHGVDMGIHHQQQCL